MIDEKRKGDREGGALSRFSFISGNKFLIKKLILFLSAMITFIEGWTMKRKDEWMVKEEGAKHIKSSTEGNNKMREKKVLNVSIALEWESCPELKVKCWCLPSLRRSFLGVHHYSVYQLSSYKILYIIKDIFFYYLIFQITIIWYFTSLIDRLRTFTIIISYFTSLLLYFQMN